MWKSPKPELELESALYHECVCCTPKKLPRPGTEMGSGLPDLPTQVHHIHWIRQRDPSVGLDTASRLKQ
eukprot:2108395-Rhodomonas_salina.1